MQYRTTVTGVGGEPPIQQKLPLSVLDVMGRGGARALSARTIAQHAGVSASAINYNFGSLDRLLTSSLEIADEQRAQFWRTWQARLPELPLSKDDLGPLLCAVNRACMEDLRGAELLFNREVIEAGRQSREIEVVEGLKEEQSFWKNVIEVCSLGELFPESLQAFALAVRFSYGLFHLLTDYDPWAFALQQRFADRIGGQAPAGSPDNAFRKMYETAASSFDTSEVSMHDTANRIVEAAARMVMEEGAESVTHRSVAAAANLSVSSVQHFFGARNTLIEAVYGFIYQTVRNRAVADWVDMRFDSATEFMRALYKNWSDSPIPALKEVVALRGMMTSAAEDPTTAIVAKALLARQGRTAENLLRRFIFLRGEVGRLDGQLLSMSTGHIWTLHPISSHRAKSAPLDLQSKIGSNLVSALFL